VTRTPLRRILPLTPRKTREQLRAVVPRTLWSSPVPAATDVASAGPLLLSFHGTTFMDACFAWLAGTGDLPPQRAWRDWCEPPPAMLAAGGKAAYPASIQRGTCWGLRDDQGLEVNPPDLRAFGVPDGPPAWLRKLYLPQHDRFTVVVLELICLAAGWPPLDRRRVQEAGLVVRRLRRGAPAGPEEWEDWIVAGPRQGRWQRLAGDQPAAAELATLASQPLALAPTTLVGMGQRCVLHGYLSLTGAEQETPASAIPLETRAKAAAALQSRAEGRLLALAASALAADREPLRSLLLGSQAAPGLLVDTVLPLAPTTQEVAAAETSLAVAQADLDPLLEQTLLALLERALDAQRFITDMTGAVASGADLWNDPAPDRLVAVARTRLAGLPGGGGMPAAISGGDIALLEVLVRHRLAGLLGSWILGEALPMPSDPVRALLFREGLLPALVAAALVRARGGRLALAAAMNRAQGLPTNDLTTPDPVSTPPPGVQARALHSLADLGEGLASFLASEEERQAGRGLAPWGTYIAPATSARLERVDSRLRALAEAYAPFEAGLSEAGAAVGFELRQRADVMETSLRLNALRTKAGLAALSQEPPSLLALGLDLLEPPAAGLLLLPGLGDGMAQRLAAFQAAVLTRYGDASNAAHEAEALVASQLPRPRFDAHHIYAVRAWVKVAPRGAGEAEQLIWSARSEPFVLAEPTDLLGCQPQAVPLPDVGRLLRDLGRLRKAGANPFLTLVPPPRSGAESDGGLSRLRRDWGLGTPVALVAPVLAMLGVGMLSGALRTVSVLPGFAWLRQVVVRSPAPERRP
jgi:hypothetical protein